jgi:hypothetical protein
MIERRFTKAKRSHERPGDGYVNVSSWPNPEIRGHLEHRDPWLKAELP